MKCRLYIGFLLSFRAEAFLSSRIVMKFQRFVSERHLFPVIYEAIGKGHGTVVFNLRMTRVVIVLFLDIRCDWADSLVRRDDEWSNKTIRRTNDSRTYQTISTRDA